MYNERILTLVGEGRNHVQIQPCSLVSLMVIKVHTQYYSLPLVDALQLSFTHCTSKSSSLQVE